MENKRQVTGAEAYFAYKFSPTPGVLECAKRHLLACSWALLARSQSQDCKQCFFLIIKIYQKSTNYTIFKLTNPCFENLQGQSETKLFWSDDFSKMFTIPKFRGWLIDRTALQKSTFRFDPQVDPSLQIYSISRVTRVRRIFLWTWLALFCLKSCLESGNGM